MYGSKAYIAPCDILVINPDAIICCYTALWSTGEVEVIFCSYAAGVVL